MFRQKNRSKRRSRAMLSAYSIIMILIILLGILSHVLPKPQYSAVGLEDESPSEEIGPGEWEDEVPAEGAEGAELSQESFEPTVGDEVTGEDLPEEIEKNDRWEGLNAK